MHSAFKSSGLIRLLAVAAMALQLLGCSGGEAPPAAEPATTTDVPTFKIAWSIYVGWMPWDYADKSGILKKWADKYNIRIELTQINDYVESINQYAAGAFDGCVMTNMDMLTIPAAGGVDSTALIVGDYSNGNDGIVVKGKGAQLAALKGASINLVELSVSHYLLARALESVKLTERDVTVVNTSDADFVAAYQAADTKAIVAWKPALSEILATPDAQLVYDSSQIPGEILDLMVVNSATLKANPNLGKALVGAWYETLGVMLGSDAAAQTAKEQMAAASGTDLAGFDSQLATTRLYATPAEAHAVVTGEEILTNMDLVRRFSFEHGLLGEGAQTVDAVGIEFPGGRTLGDAGKITMRFDDTYVKMAVDGML